MTEEEARTKWCPMARVPVADSGFKCIASDCMMWRDVLEQYNVTKESLQKDLKSWNSTDIIIERETGNGYCGLAGGKHDTSIND